MLTDATRMANALGQFSVRSIFRPVLKPKPLGNFLRIEAYCPADMKTRQRTTSSHAIDVFVVHAKQFAEFRNLHGTTSCFELFDQVHAGASKVGLSPLPSYLFALLSNTSKRWGHLSCIWGICQSDS